MRRGGQSEAGRLDFKVTASPQTIMQPLQAACSHLLCVKGGVALLALAAVALTMEKPAGGAVELWLGCTSFGMPLWEAN